MSSATPPKNFKPIPTKRPGAFPGVEFDHVEAYAITQPNPPELYSPLKEDGMLTDEVVRPGARLDAAQIKRLLSIIRAKSSYRRDRISACFEPRHAFIFYDSSGTPVAMYNVCFACRDFVAEPDLEGVDKLYPFTDDAFSKMTALCQELGLNYCPEGASASDLR